MVVASPCSRGTSGSHPNTLFGRVISGRRTLGSSVGQRPVDQFAGGAAHANDRLANSARLSSCGLPMLTGSFASDCISRRMPSTSLRSPRPVREPSDERSVAPLTPARSKWARLASIDARDPVRNPQKAPRAQSHSPDALPQLSNVLLEAAIPRAYAVQG